MPKGKCIVALGSSFAAGACIEPIINTNANRSGQNYAHQLLEKINTTSKYREPATLTDLTVSGATVLNLTQECQHAGNTTFPPQLDQVPKDADIILFTCGGNDVRYIGGLIDESHIARDCYPPDHGKATVPPITWSALSDRIGAALDKAHQIAPNATVYLVQYLTVVGSTSKKGADFLMPTWRRLFYKEMARDLASAYVSAAKNRSWARVVPVARASQDHGVGSREPWVSGLNAPAPYHPTREGHRQIAGMLFEQLLRERML